VVLGLCPSSTMDTPRNCVIPSVTRQCQNPSESADEPSLSSAVLFVGHFYLPSSLRPRRDFIEMLLYIVHIMYDAHTFYMSHQFHSPLSNAKYPLKSQRKQPNKHRGDFPTRKQLNALLPQRSVRSNWDGLGARQARQMK
jgi:hypothetical protein